MSFPKYFSVLYPNLASVFSQHVRFLRFFELKIFSKNHKSYNKRMLTIFKCKEIHDFYTFLKKNPLIVSWFRYLMR